MFNSSNSKERIILREKVEAKQKERSASFKQLKLEHEDVQEITILSFDELSGKLQRRELSATQVLSAFIGKSLKVTDEFNCVTEYIPYAMKMAEELDSMDEIKGSLHGIPICIKDDTDVKGMDSTVGYARNINKPAKKSATLVEILIEEGAIPFCKTNLPQTCISFASNNPIFGKTLNPLNKKLSPGGSSSGTGCLVAANGAPFGTGSDTGGSGRVPAHFCGISTIKPTKDRLSRQGFSQCIQKCIGLTSVPAILAQRASEVAQIFKAVTYKNQQHENDGISMPIPWNEKDFSSTHKLKIGYFTSLSQFPTMGDTTDIVLKAKNALGSFGHEMIPFEIDNSEEIMSLILELSGADMGTNLVKMLKNDQVADVIEGLYEINKMPFWKRKLFSKFPNFFGVNPVYINAGMNIRESKDLWDSMTQRDEIIRKILDNMKNKEIDLILCPSYAFPAIRVDDITRSVEAAIYTFMWNLVDFPAGIVKFGIESGKNQNKNYNHKGDFMKQLALESIKESIGMPIGVQIVGKPYEEELVLRVMKELEILA